MPGQSGRLLPRGNALQTQETAILTAPGARAARRARRCTAELLIDCEEDGRSGRSLSGCCGSGAQVSPGRAEGVSRLPAANP